MLGLVEHSISVNDHSRLEAEALAPPTSLMAQQPADRCPVPPQAHAGGDLLIGMTDKLLKPRRREEMMKLVVHGPSGPGRGRVAGCVCSSSSAQTADTMATTTAASPSSLWSSRDAAVTPHPEPSLQVDPRWQLLQQQRPRSSFQPISSLLHTT